MDESKALLGETEIALLLRCFSVPDVIGVLVNVFYNVVDSIFRCWRSCRSLASVKAPSQLLAIITVPVSTAGF